MEIELGIPSNAKTDVLRISSCLFCHKTNNNYRNLFPTCCECDNAYVHLECVREYGKKNPDQNIKYCIKCNKRFNGSLLYKIHNNIGVSESSVSESSVSESKKRIISLSVLLFLSICATYAGISYYLIHENYSKPREIKKNQIETVCNITDIKYDFNREYVSYNDNIVTEYKITSAYGSVVGNSNDKITSAYGSVVGNSNDKITSAYGSVANNSNDNNKINMIKLVTNDRFVERHVSMLKNCVVYIKNNKVIYLATDKHVIEKKFKSYTYILYIIFGGLIIIIVGVFILYLKNNYFSKF